jgi:hypothetical protein
MEKGRQRDITIERWGGRQTETHNKRDMEIDSQRDTTRKSLRETDREGDTHILERWRQNERHNNRGMEKRQTEGY